MADRPRIYVTRRLPAPVLALLEGEADLAVWPGDLPPPRAVLRRELATADGLLALSTDRVDAALLDAGPRLRAIGVVAIGESNIDMDAATARGVPVVAAPELLAEAAADFTLALLLAAARHVVDGAAYTRAGQWRVWQAEALLGRDLHGATLGLVGLGRVGTAVARRAAGFGMRLLYAAPRPAAAAASLGAERAALPELLAASDFISLHCPLTDETYHLVDRDALAVLRPGATLINTAHGLLVDTRALVAALESRPLAAALDVTDPEPLPPDHPLLRLPNALVTPHMAGGAAAARRRVAMVAAAGLLAALRGERPAFLANPAVWRERALACGDS